MTARPRQTTTVCEETLEGGVSKAAARSAEAVAAATDQRLHPNHDSAEIKTRIRFRKSILCFYLKVLSKKNLCFLYIKKYS
jgi:hypothetical protein